MRITAAIAVGAGCLAFGAVSPLGQQAIPTFHANTTLVLVNLSVRDRNGNPVRDLRRGEITLYEDGKPQTIASFDFQDLSRPAVPVVADTKGPESVVIGGAASKPGAPPAPLPLEEAKETYRDRRLVVLYFDLTTMQPEDIEDVVKQADNFVQKQMQPADLVAIASLGNTLQVNQDFTDDRDALMKQLAELNPSTGSGFESGGDGTTDGTADDGNSFASDDTEFNLANADRSLEAIQTLAEMLAPIEQKKSVLFFSDGISRSGVDNEITLRSAVNAAVKANVSLYSVDARGLQARVPGGSANTASTRGRGSYSGATVLNALNSQFSQQETVATLANDTGGEAFLDSNDFSPAYTKVETDTESYYLIGYHSANPSKDGRYRKIRIVVRGRPGLKLAFRPGYYADRDIGHMDTSDRRAQLLDQLTSDTPDQSLPVYANDGFLRLAGNRYFIPVSVAIPGSAIPLRGAHANATPSVDVDGMVRDQALRQIGHMQDTVRLDSRLVGGSGGHALESRNLQYSTGFTVTPGVYEIRLAARENQSGQMGAFGTVVRIPDLGAEEAKQPSTLALSSVLIGSQLSATRPNREDPLTASGEALVESVTHVFSSRQHLYVYFEVYDPKLDAAGKPDVATSVAFYRGKVRVFQTPLLHQREVTDPARHAVVVQLDLPLAPLAPGTYTCQVNAMDELAQRFAFPRVPLLVRAERK